MEIRVRMTEVDCFVAESIPAKAGTPRNYNFRPFVQIRNSEIYEIRKPAKNYWSVWSQTR